MIKDIDPFEEEDWEELELNSDHIYDVIYGCVMSYYKERYMEYNVVKKDDVVLLKEKLDDENSQIICSFTINENNDKVEILYENQEKRIVNLVANIKNDKFKVFFDFRVTFDKYLKEKDEENN